MDSSTKIVYKDLKFLFHVECLNLITSYNIFLSDSIDELIGPPYIIIVAPPLGGPKLSKFFVSLTILFTFVVLTLLLIRLAYSMC
jgi:hypothetical protein